MSNSTPSTIDWIRLGSILAGIALIIPVVLAVLEIVQTRPTTWDGWLKAGATLLAAIVAGLIYWASKRNESNNVSGAQAGRKRVMQSWNVSSRGLLSAGRHLAVAMGQARPVRPEEGKRTVREAIVCARKIVVSVFENVDEDLLTVTIGVPLEDDSAMKIVEVTPETANRIPGMVYPFPPANGDLHSMLRAYKLKQPIYTSDAHLIPGMEGKEYRSILSFPVMSQDRCVIAVVNVDGRNAGMFDTSVHDGPDQAAIKLVNELLQPALQLMVIALEHCQPYSRKP